VANRRELHVTTERPFGQPGERILGLLDMLDLDELGTPPTQLSSSMSATVTAPLNLATEQINDLVGQTLHYIGSGFGFLDPDDADL
jgi:hypothetical protein